MTILLRDLRYSLRALRRSPGFTIVILLTLTLGIGANTTIFSVVNAVLLRPLPYHDADQIVTITTDPKDATAGTAYDHYLLWKSASRSFQEMAVYYRNTGWSRVILTVFDEPELAQAGYTSASFFSVMGVPPVLGRVFTSLEEMEQERVVVLSSELWKRQFGSAPDVIGKNVKINREKFTIIGVMPATFQFPAKETQLWAPITTNRHWLDRPVKDNRRNQNFYWRWNVIARLKPGVTISAAGAEVEALTKRSGNPDLFSNHGIGLSQLQLNLSKQVKLALLVLMSAVSFVLLIACINVTTLLLARGSMRDREIAIQMALGAQRQRIVQQLLTEHLVLALIAGAGGLLLAVIGTKVLSSMAPPDIPRIEQVGIDWWVLGYTLLISVVTAMFSGLLPVWKVSGTSLTGALQAGGRSLAGSASRSRMAALLIALEFSLSMVLLTGATLLLRSFIKIQNLDPGFRPDQVLTMRIDLPGRSADQRTAFYEQLYERLGTLPGVQSVGSVKELFEAGDPRPLGLRSVDGREPEPENRWSPLVWTTVGGEFFSAIGAPLLKGRFFSPQDTQNSPPVAIVDESTARRYWPDEDPIGKRFKGQDPRGQNDEWVTVIGVVRDMRRQGLENQAVPHIFEWSRQAIHDPTPYLAVRATGDPLKLVGSLRNSIRTLDDLAVISRIATLQSQLEQQLASRVFQIWLIGLFSVIALILASVGIYGLMYYTVAQRMHEIGIRMALGAQTGKILAMFIRRGMAMVILGLAVGLASSLLLTRLIESLLYGVTPTDPITLAGASVLLLVVAVTATLIPAWSATKVDPLIVMRE